ncbi:hypothetical protein OPIT5_14090 [Opitutaceae bacterium TAV5]|nr:hypothetical protein OPIT5_14090 [Opitutaceae bacterium TAV5]
MKSRLRRPGHANKTKVFARDPDYVPGVVLSGFSLFPPGRVRRVLVAT